MFKTDCPELRESLALKDIRMSLRVYYSTLFFCSRFFITKQLARFCHSHFIISFLSEQHVATVVKKDNIKIMDEKKHVYKYECFTR